MRTVIVVPCSGPKLDRPAPAADLYQSAIFKHNRRIAEACKVDWFIFSAKYGLLRPDTLIEPYDMVIKHNAAMIKKARHTRTDLPPVADKATLARLKRAASDVLIAYDRRIYLMGDNYCKDLPPAERPLGGMGIGKQVGMLSRMTPADLGL